MSTDAEPLPLLLDLDTGIDDSLALLLACASPEAALLACTAVGGNVGAATAARNTRAVLELAGRGEVEVALGALRPLLRAPADERGGGGGIHGPSGLGDAVLPEPRMPPSPRHAVPGPRHAVEVFLEETRRRPGEVVLVATGPLTNLALAVLREPEVLGRLRRLVVMGGAYAHPGNITPAAEFNIHADPEAACIVFRALATHQPREGPAVAIGLDVTERVRLAPADLDAVPAGAVARFLRAATGFYMGFHERQHGFRGCFLHDPLAVAVALDPTLVTTRPITVEVETAGEWTAGQTVADWRGRWGRPPNLAVATEVRAEEVVRRFVARVADLARAVGA